LLVNETVVVGAGGTPALRNAGHVRILRNKLTFRSET
jgi:hypothetical protein